MKTGYCQQVCNTVFLIHFVYIFIKVSPYPKQNRFYKSRSFFIKYILYSLCQILPQFKEKIPYKVTSFICNNIFFYRHFTVYTLCSIVVFCIKFTGVWITFYLFSLSVKADTVTYTYITVKLICIQIIYHTP